MSESAVRAARPTVLTVAIVLVYINALAEVASGILIFLSRYDVDADEVLIVSLLGATTILFGLLILAVASGVGRGSQLSRILLTIYIGVLAALDILTIVGTDAWDVTSTISVAVEAFVLVTLWLPPVSRYVRAQSAA